MVDASIRPVTIGEQAEIAARRAVATHESQPNPHEGTEHEQRWNTLYERWVQQLSALEGTEAGA